MLKKIMILTFILSFGFSLNAQQQKKPAIAKTPSKPAAQKTAEAQNKTQLKAEKTPFEKSVEALSSPNVAERRLAAQNLGSMRDLKAAPHLEKLLSDKDDSVKIAAIDSLGLMRSYDSEPKISALLMTEKNALVSQACVIAISYMGKASNPQALHKAAEEGQERSLRISALRVLGSLNVKTSEDFLLKILKKEKDIEVKKAAIDALGKIKSVKGAQEIKKYVTDADMLTRQYAIRALGDIGDKSYIEDLKSRLNEEDPSIKMEAALSLAKLEDSFGLETAHKYIDSADFSLQNQSMQVLSMVGNEKSLSILEDKIKAEKRDNVKSMLEFTKQRIAVRIKLSGK